MMRSPRGVRRQFKNSRIKTTDSSSGKSWAPHLHPTPHLINISVRWIPPSRKWPAAEALGDSESLSLLGCDGPPIISP